VLGSKGNINFTWAMTATELKAHVLINKSLGWFAIGVCGTQDLTMTSPGA
jgi:hypothetical protein